MITPTVPNHTKLSGSKPGKVHPGHWQAHRSQIHFFQEVIMAKETPRDKDKVYVFQQGNSEAENYLIPAGTIAGRGNARLKKLLVVDLMHIVGLRNKDGNISGRVSDLTVDDIHQLGQIFASHTGMNYPDKIMSCCCCT